MLGHDLKYYTQSYGLDFPCFQELAWIIKKGNYYSYSPVQRLTLIIAGGNCWNNAASQNSCNLYDRSLNKKTSMLKIM